MNIDEMLDGRVPSAPHVLGRGFQPWLYAAAAFGMMAALFDPAIALAQADACPNKGGTLTFARSADVSGWYYQDNNPTIWAWPLVSLALVRNKVDASGLEGAAAESWEASPDSKTFTFHLRKDLKFSDGSSLTSADVVDSFNSSMNDAQNVQQGIWPKGTTIAGPDPSTVVITITDPQPAFVDNLLSQVGIYPKGSKPADLVTHPVSAGPFMLADWQKGQRAVLKRNPYFWNQPYPCVDEVDLLVVGDSATQALQLQAGQVDIAEELPPNQLEALRRSPGVTVPVFPTLGEELIRLQRTKQPAFQDENVRLAMNYAIDKNAIVNLVFFGTAVVEDSEMPRTKFYKAQTPYTYDLAKAKKLMAASAFPKGFKTSLLISSGDAVESGIATIVKDQLAAIGIDVAIQQVEAGTKFELRGKKDFEMFLATTSADQIDPQIFWYFCCAQGFNLGSAFTDYLSPENQALFTKVQIEGDPAKRADLFTQMQKVVWDDAAQLYLVFLEAPMGIRSNIKGFVLPPSRHHYLEKVYKTP
jgi:peptide/nickel transport system substrate-binding protein